MMNPVETFAFAALICINQGLPAPQSYASLAQDAGDDWPDCGH